MLRPGIFLSVEGNEGAGKTTLVHRLGLVLPESIQVREPGGTRIGEKIREVLLDPENKGMHPLTEFFLFLSSRVKFVDAIVKPALDEGKVVIADRFALSTMAYQIAARGLPERECLSAIDLAVQGCEPDLYILLLVPPRIGSERQKLQGKKADRLESEALEFHEKVYQGYLRFGRGMENCVIIDTTNLTKDQVYRETCKALVKKFPVRLRSLRRECL